MLAKEWPVSTEQIKEFVVAAHFNLEKTKQMLAESPTLLNVQYQWGEGDTETAIQAAAHAGNRANVEFLLEKGAPLEICTAAMLGLQEDVERRIVLDPDQTNATGAHRIPLLAHTALSGNLPLVELVFKKGATTGPDLALHNATYKGNTEIVNWLLDNAGANINSKNFQGKTPLQVAIGRKDEPLAKLLGERGAT